MLRSILYVHNLKCNLIVVGHLILDSQCFVTFTDHLCIVQDRTWRRTIDLGELRNGVYVFMSYAGDSANIV